MDKNFEEYVSQLTRQERDELQKAIWKFNDDHVCKVRVRKGQIVRYVTEGSFPDCYERKGIALDNYDNAKWFSVLEYLSEEHDCYRTSNVNAERVIEITNQFIDLSALEADYRKQIPYTRFKEVVDGNMV